MGGSELAIQSSAYGIEGLAGGGAACSGAVRGDASGVLRRQSQCEWSVGGDFQMRRSGLGGERPVAFIRV